jgi:hypothetical protein
MSKKHSFHMYINNALFDMNNVDSEITSILKDIMGDLMKNITVIQPDCRLIYFLRI